MQLPPKDDKVCANCKYLAWMIGIGQGLRCTHKSVYDQATFNSLPPVVPSSRHTCDKFESKYPEDM